MNILRISLLVILPLGICSISASGHLLEENDKQAETEKPTQDASQPEAKKDVPRKITKSEMQARMRRAGVSTQVWLDVLKFQDVTEIQKGQITKMVRAYQERFWKWNQTDGKKLSGLQAEMKKFREDKKDVPEDIRAQVMKLRNERPRAWDMQEKVWNEMTEAQQKAFRERLDAAKVNGFVAPQIPKGRKSRETDSVEERSLPASKDAVKEPKKAPEKTPDTSGEKKPAVPKKAEDGKKTDGKAKGYKPWSFFD